jgi:hypothetical protein
MNYSLLGQYNNADFINGNDKKFYETIDVPKNIKNYNMPLYGNNPNDNWGNISDNVLKGALTSTPLSELFFSRDNINRLQQMIKSEVFKRSNGKYLMKTNQNESDLIIVMRAVYISDALNAPYRIVHQVKKLNHLVIERIVDEMITNIKTNEEYLNQLDKPINPIPLPVCSASAGRRTLPPASKTFF